MQQTEVGGGKLQQRRARLAARQERVTTPDVIKVEQFRHNVVRLQCNAGRSDHRGEENQESAAKRIFQREADRAASRVC